MILRDYQQNIRDSVIREWKEHTSTLVVAPTGCGKTVIFAAIIEAMQPQRAMVIAHREELIWQARDKIKAVTGLECEVEMSDLWANKGLFGDVPVIISTIQTQNSKHGDRKRMSRFDPKEFGVLIIDEAHHGTAESYKNLINYYKTNNPDIRILGVTATPDRADEEALGQVFESCPDEQDYEILDAIHDGWLVPIEQQFVHIDGLDFSEMRTTAGDLNGADLAAVMESEENVQGVVMPSLEVMFGLPPHSLESIHPSLWSEHIQQAKTRASRTIVFTASVKQAEVMSSIFNRHRNGMADWVCGATNKDKRREILGKFDKGEIQVVVNCGVLTEGYDNPGVECIVMARPTKSRSLYAQMAGRSTRPWPGLVDGIETPELRRQAIKDSRKPNCEIVDFVGNSGRHKLMSSADILGGKVSDDALERAVERAKKLGKAVNMAELLDEEDAKVRKESEERRRLEEARKAKLVAKVKFSSRSVNPFDVLEIQPVNERGWDRGRTISDKQKSLLLKQGVNPDTLPYAQARQLINEMFRRWDRKLCSLKQAQVLKRYGYETKDLTRDDASRMMDALAKNNWRKVAFAPATAANGKVPF